MMTDAPLKATNNPVVRITRALISVSDKSGIIDLAQTLTNLGVQIISTGGTAKTLAGAGIPVTEIEKITGFPEMMDGRVKTLHPKIHGGLLARRDTQAHLDSMNAHDIAPIDLVVVNLYPFESTIAKPSVTDQEAIEQIDIGGPSMVRSAAKNHQSVAIITHPSQYESLLKELQENNGSTTLELRKKLAADAFTTTAHYDAAISTWMNKDADGLPDKLTIGLTKINNLRYGENPHQTAALYQTSPPQPGTLVNAKQLHGKPLSFNNINDASAALELVAALKNAAPDQHAACVLKHTNPCGASCADTNSNAVDAAIAGDPMAAFGGILATNTTIDLKSAQRITADGTFFEVVIAPSFEPDALKLLQSRWKNLRILEVGNDSPNIKQEIKWIPGGLLVQDRDLIVPDPASWTHAAGPKPTDQTLQAAAILEPICTALSSNAILIGGIESNRVRLFGAGAGQMDRVASCLGAIRKAGDLSKGSIALSDAFFPFPDGPQILIDAGVSMIVHPGGSKRDTDTFDLCNQHNITCMTTGIRHFRH
ncbi:MAG: bifunctional phosphoribosylaminoimidazolecarboxamide formyltransferase/IMP cyclohydrolase [Phycisphaerales bacterium]|nr:bifunctional phosphoribosylaminoimidazolecarboxamide formyltransferase/IMP cyclohydrolase [Phycisphaerales bacterium]